MEEWKEKVPVLIAVICIVALMVGSYYFLVVYKETYYTKIDNTKVEKLLESDMKFQYTLLAYNEKGKEKEIQFKTSRQLREGAYLQLDVMQMRGVVDWREVEKENLPDDVKSNMENDS